MTVKAIPNGYHSVQAGMNLKDVPKAIEFFKKAFGAEERMRMPMPDGTVMHAEVQVGDSVLMMSEAVRDPVHTLHAMLYVQDCDATIKRAVDAGAKVLMPIMDHFWGDRGGRIEDPFGNKWFIATHKEDVAPADIPARQKAFMEQMAAQKKN